MSVPGSFGVSPTGAATYEIPFKVPPGIAGMEPKLSLAYNSQQGNGLLGVGWGLNGLSAITRCPRTTASDGTKGGVNYDANDRFCLDGQRLIAISGTYGANGTEYRTERESFTKVISYGTAGNGPSYFVAKTKSGQTIEYGNTTDSKIEAQGKSSVRVWALNKMQDTKGNYLTVTYTEDNTNGDFYPSRIDYTGNTTASLSPAQSVQFTYDTRTDVVPAYQAGSVIKTMKRLINAKTYAGAALVRDYQITYDTSPTTQRSRITTVKECDAASVCISPTSITMHNGSIVGGYAATGHTMGSAEKYVGDFNGDGKTDLYSFDYQQAGSNIYGTGYFCAGGSGSCTTINLNGLFSYEVTTQGKMYAGDFNGDGITDIVITTITYVYPDEGAAAVEEKFYFCAGPGITSSNNCTQFGPSVTGTHSNGDNPELLTFLSTVYVGDFNGDGRADLFRAHDGNSSYCPGNASGLSCNSAISWPSFSAPVSYGSFSITAYVGDFNGDGIADFYRVAAYPGYVGGYFCPGPGVTTGNNCVLNHSNNWGPSTFSIHPGDYNGDGITDLFLVGSSASYFCPGSLLSLSGGASCSTAVSGNWRSSYVIYPGDYNGDGLTDLLLVGSSNSYFCSGATLVSTANCQGVLSGNWQPYAAFPGDYSGRGTTDVFMYYYAQSYYATFTNINAPDQVSNIANGLGVSASLTYAPLTSSTVYTKDSSATYPVANLKVPLHVISSVVSSNGVGGTTTTNYTYGGLKAELGTGRGLLGFRWTEATQADTGIKSRVEYKQDWPYVGLPLQTKRIAPGGSPILSQVDNTFGCMNPATGASSCTVAAGNRYFPYVSQSDETSNDLNGAFINKVRTVNGVPDLYGNLTSITVSNLTSGGSATGYSKVTTNTYATPDTTNWILGRLVRSEVQSNCPGTDSTKCQ